MLRIYINSDNELVLVLDKKKSICMPRVEYNKLAQNILDTNLNLILPQRYSFL